MEGDTGVYAHLSRCALHNFRHWAFRSIATTEHNELAEVREMRLTSTLFHTVLPLAVSVLLAWEWNSPARASSLDIYDGATQIGTLTASNAANGSGESATFQLASSDQFLMNDAAGTQFRFFQVIYYDDEPVKYQGHIITPAHTTAHSGTVVDVPVGGWDYELPEGDDDSPFYESDTEDNPTTGKPYAYPTLSYPDLHSDVSGYSLTDDAPTETKANDQTLFETFLAYVNPTLGAAHRFDLLGGYSWGIQNNASAKTTGIAAADIPRTAIDLGTVAELQDALNRSGFTGEYAWTVESYDLSTFARLPEPSEWVLVGGAMVLLMFRQPRRGLRD